MNCLGGSSVALGFSMKHWQWLLSIEITILQFMAFSLSFRGRHLTTTFTDSEVIWTDSVVTAYRLNRNGNNTPKIRLQCSVAISVRQAALLLVETTLTNTVIQSGLRKDPFEVRLRFAKLNKAACFSCCSVLRRLATSNFKGAGCISTKRPQWHAHWIWNIICIK